MNDFNDFNLHNSNELSKIPALIIFDVDGIITIPHTGQLLPGRREFFRSLWQWSKLKIALATNAGGVGFRHYLETERPAWLTEKSPEEQAAQLAIYPTQAEAEAQIESVALAIRRATRELKPFSTAIQIYISFIWRFKNGGYIATPPGIDKDPRWLQSYRKPGPGMLLQAMNDTGVSAAETLMIGDRSEDAEAAQAGGCNFAWAKDFFGEVVE